MSEISNAGVDVEEEGGFSRRRVVAGVAWSLPVIATAIAAPAAAASPPPISATAALVNGAAPQYSKIGGGGTKYGGTAPATLSLNNTGTSSFTGTVSVNIKLAPVGTVLVGIGVESLSPATTSAAVSFTQHASTTSFSYSGAIAAGQTLNFTILYNYETVNPKPSAVTYSFVMTTSVVLTANAGGSLSLTPTASPNPTIQF
ncbi:hypothetical protein NMQ03_16515 [Arthrobacter sp. DNA4]|uniref:hypothetical protein n=1 Tax=Arthrobacter sp. DNA4 TaxID=2963432 RepID=UPI0020CDC120|nr:hypothetical protein [Arthrobacter sp. DNA4]UTT68809.1 hypothetical protein NMQ03_16515 [Arthrobacter sp. DNA4]